MSARRVLQRLLWLTAIVATVASPSAATAAAQNVAAKRPQVRVLATGGTIAATGSSRLDLSNYKSGTILGIELVRAVPEIEQVAEVKVEQLCLLKTG